MINDTPAAAAPDFERIVATNEYGSYAVPSSSAHRPAAKAILKSKVWEKSTIQFMVQIVGDGDIVHAGAFFGDFLPALSKNLSPGAELWAFEPNPENFFCAGETMRLNGLSNVHLRNAGLGNSTQLGKLRIRARGEALGGASRFVEDHARNDAEDVVDMEIVRIDDVLPAERKVSVLQFDLEGFEFVALIGAFQTVVRCRPTIILEKNKPIPKCAELLSSIDYDQLGEVGPNIVFAPSSNRARIAEEIAALK